jgi:Asp-tRNA(Asn)/Glu-tRNA(Gln) amidotransferase A subunit family amidase
MASFDRTVGELKAAGAVVVDPIVIPGLNELQKSRAGDPGVSEKALEAWLARNPNSPFHTRADIANSPDIDKAFPPSKSAQWKRPAQQSDLKKYGEYLVARQQLMINILKVMADNHLDAIVYRTVEHSPTLISIGTQPPYPSNKGVPILNTFLVYVPVITVPSGFTPDHLPTGITFMGRPYSDAQMIALAYAYEQATHHRMPPKSTPPLLSP